MMTKINNFMTTPVTRKSLLIDSIVANTVMAAIVIGIGTGVYIAGKQFEKEEKKKKPSRKERRYATIK